METFVNRLEGVVRLLLLLFAAFYLLNAVDTVAALLDPDYDQLSPQSINVMSILVALYFAPGVPKFFHYRPRKKKRAKRLYFARG